MFEAAKKKLSYEFKCNDDIDGDFSHCSTVRGVTDTTDFAQFIEHIEQFEITKKQFNDNFILPKNDKILDKIDKKYDTKFYAGLNGETDYAVIFLNEDIHYIYEILT